MIYGFYFFTVFISVIFYLKSFRAGFFFFITTYFIYPRAFAIGVGASGFALTMQRAELVMLGIYMTWRLLTKGKDRQYLFTTIANYAGFYAITFMLWGSEILASLVNATPGQATDTLSGLSDDLFFTIVFVLGATLAIRNVKDVALLIKIFCVAMILNFVVACVEMHIGHTIFQNVKILFNESSDRDITESRFKDGVLRAQGLMDSSLVLAYSGFLIFVLAYGYTRLKKYFRIKIAIAVWGILACVVAIYFTRSRASLGLVCGGTAVFFIYNRIKSLTKIFHRQFTLLIFAAIVLIFIVAFVFVPLFSYINQFETGSSVNVSQDVSANERFSQLFSILKANGIHFAFGWGRLRYLPGIVPDDIINDLDNYFIRQFLESGILGLTLLLMYIYRLVRFSISNFRLSFYFQNNKIKAFYFILIFYSLGIFLILNLSSSIVLNIFVYTFLPILIVLKEKAISTRKELALLNEQNSQPISESGIVSI